MPNQKPHQNQALASRAGGNHSIQEYLICDNCGYYPLQPVHGHYVCGQCYMPTKCCEGAPLDK